MGNREWTMPLPEFGEYYYGLGKSASYSAARDGLIPVIRIRGKWLGLVRVAEEQLSKPAKLEANTRAET
jgi:hypothetical protein